MTAANQAQAARELRRILVDVYRDGISTSATANEIRDRADRILAEYRLDRHRTPVWPNLPAAAKEGVRAYVQCFIDQLVERYYVEFGQWVEMPYTGEKFFWGLEERVDTATALAKLSARHYLDKYGLHKYIHDRTISGTSGFYWLPIVFGKPSGRAAHMGRGMCPYSVGISVRPGLPTGLEAQSRSPKVMP